MKAQLKRTIVMSLAVLAVGIFSVSTASAQRNNKGRNTKKVESVKKKATTKKVSNTRSIANTRNARNLAPAKTVNNRNNHGYAKAGHRVGVVPRGASRINHGGHSYYVADGVFYRLISGRQYQVVNPPAGLRLSRLPAGYTSIKRNGRNYYQHNGHYYEQQRNNSGVTVFQIVLF